MKIYADLHLHSKYSRATSPDMTIPILALWSKKKGLTLLGTGDFTHPLYLGELKRDLQDRGQGIYWHKDTAFMLTTEVCNIFHWQGKLKKIHCLIFTPSLETAETLNGWLSKYGNLAADGRPILSLTTRDLLDLIKNVNPKNELVCAHAWTPHFSLYGSNSGFDSIADCFGARAKDILAIETGLSSDPLMNWRIKELDGISIISNSDAHSPRRLAREANCFELPILSYDAVMGAIRRNNPKEFLMTVEFYPEEGKYHWDGHRSCKVRLHPQKRKKLEGFCPQCQRPVTLGVLSRVEALAGRSEQEARVLGDRRIPYKNIIPLEEIIADALSVGRESKRVAPSYEDVLQRTELGELQILLEASPEFLIERVPPKIVEGILKARRGELDIEPGYDGEYGKISIRWGNTKLSDCANPQLAEKVVAVG